MGPDILQLKITRIEAAATDTMLFYLEALNKEPILYEAGQFFTFIVYHNGKESRRSYSVITTPGIDKELAVLIKRRVNGEISRYLIDHLKPGDVLYALKPAGRFTINTDSSHRRTVVFIAAGSGISPVFSMLKKVLYGEAFSKVVLIDQNRNEESVLFRKELETLQQLFSSRFAWVSLLSNPAGKGHFPKRLNNSLLEQLIETHAVLPDAAVFYICGPFPFMRMIQFVLKLMGFRDEQIRKEYFVIEPNAPAPALVTDRSPKNIRLKWKSRVYHYLVSYPVNILQGALDHNIDLPYSCRGGRCSTCTVTCLSGTVKMSINEVLTEKDLRAGLVLTCVGYAETDLELEL